MPLSSPHPSLRVNQTFGGGGARRGSLVEETWMHSEHTSEHSPRGRLYTFLSPVSNGRSPINSNSTTRAALILSLKPAPLDKYIHVVKDSRYVSTGSLLPRQIVEIVPSHHGLFQTGRFRLHKQPAIVWALPQTVPV